MSVAKPKKKRNSTAKKPAVELAPSRLELPYVMRELQPHSERSIFLSDFHVPYHSRVCVALVLQFLKWFQPSTIYLIGDIVDFYGLSRFDKDPRRISTVQEELDLGFDILTAIRQACPLARIVFREGNHEYRLTRFLWRNPEVVNIRNLQLPALLRFGELNIEHVAYDGYLVHNDSFLVEHGDIVRQKSGYTANGMLMKRGMSGISGHTHRLGSTYRTDMRSEDAWYENGCLCSTEPEYLIGTPDWQNGFCTMHSIGDRFHVEQVPIIAGKLFYHGDLWEVQEAA